MDYANPNLMMSLWHRPDDQLVRATLWGREHDQHEDFRFDAGYSSASEVEDARILAYATLIQHLATLCPEAMEVATINCRASANRDTDTGGASGVVWGETLYGSDTNSDMGDVPANALADVPVTGVVTTAEVMPGVVSVGVDVVPNRAAYGTTAAHQLPIPASAYEQIGNRNTTPGIFGEHDIFGNRIQAN